MRPRHVIFIDLHVPYGEPCPETEAVRCTRNTTIISGLAHQKFYAIRRVIADTFGPWPVIRINAKEHVVDPSVPTHLDYIPRDAVEITGDLLEDILHDSSGDHTWAGRHIQRVAALFP